MKHFKKFSTLLITLIVLSIISGSYAVNTTTDSKTINTSPIKTVKTPQNSNKIIYVAINGKDTNDGLTKAKAKRTIQNAINTAKSGDTIQVKSGTYKENLKITKNINIIGNNLKDTIIDGNQKSLCLYVEDGSKLSIKGFTIQNGKTDDVFLGAGIENRGTLDIKNVKIIHNTALQNGGGIRNAGRMFISNSVITSNKAEIYGGGISNCDTLTMDNVTISNNTAPEGAGIYSSDSMYVYTSTISGNSATGYGGGIYNYGQFELQTTKITNNNANIGGGISNYGLLFIDPSVFGISTIEGNNAKENGGGIYNYATIYGAGDTIINNNKPDDIHGDPIKPYP
jgi:hypothetical protein